MALQYLGQAFQGPSGSAFAPAFSFVDDPDTGIYGINPDQVAIATAGARRAIFSEGGLYIDNGNINISRASDHLANPRIGLFQIPPSPGVSGSAYIEFQAGGMTMQPEEPYLHIGVDDPFGIIALESDIVEVDGELEVGGGIYSVGPIETDSNLFAEGWFWLTSTGSPATYLKTEVHHGGAGASGTVFDSVTTSPERYMMFSLSGNAHLYLESQTGDKPTSTFYSSIAVSSEGNQVLHSDWYDAAPPGFFTGGITTVLDQLRITRTSYSSSQLAIGIMANTGSQYSFYADSEGSGSDNTRLWLDGPLGGQVVIGPRMSAARFNQVRIRSGSLVLDTSPYSGSAGYPVAYIRAAGNWNPTLEGTTNPSVSYSSRGGYYMRIGKLVWITARFTLSSRTGGSGTASIGNLPFLVENSEPNRSAFTIGTSGVQWPTGATALFGAAVANSARISIVGIGSNQSFPGVLVTNVSSTATFYMSGFYWTSDS